MEAQAQTKEGAHVAHQAGEWCRVHEDPGWIHAPFLSFFQSPQQIHTYSLQENIKAYVKNEQEQSDAEVPLQAGVVNPLLS